MGTTLTGTTPQDTYDSLIKVTDNGPLSGTLKTLTDGLGNDSALALSTGAASITGTLAVSGNATFDTSTLVVDAANNRVGVGTSSPDNTLEVSAASGTSTSLVKLTNSSAAAPSNIAQVGFELANSFSGANTDIVFGAIKTNSGNYDSDFYISTSSGTSTPAERMRIASTGYVGIGTTSPAYNLHINAATDSRIIITDSAQGSTANDGTYIRQSGVNSSIVNQENGTLQFGTNNSFAQTITAAGVVELVKGQLKFPATQVASADPNTLDDYEEGTWTMGVSFGGASVGVTYGSQTGTYTKIGRQVTCNGFLHITSKGSSTGEALLTGLPFTVGSGLPNYAPAALRLNEISFANQYQGLGNVGSTNIILEEITEAGVVSALTDANFSSPSYIMVLITYFV